MLWPSSGERTIGAAENSRSPASGFGSITSHGSRCAREHVLAVQILVDEHLLALRRRELADVVERERRGARSSSRRGDRRPFLRLRREREEAVAAPPEPRQQLDEHPDRIDRVREERARLAALEQQRAALVVAGEQPHRAVAVPALERVRLLLGLAVRPEDLQHRGRAVGALDLQDMTRRAGR